MIDQSAPQSPNPANGPQPAGAPTMRAMSQYVKDLSFENPGNQLPEGQPTIDIGIDVSASPHPQGNGVFESSLKLKARAHVGETSLFLIEMDYCGLFQIGGLNEADSEAALLIECPRLLFPFARRLIADVTREGGFPPLLIDPVDFVQLYRQQKARQAQAAQTTEPAPGLQGVQQPAMPAQQPLQPGSATPAPPTDGQSEV